MQLLTLWYSPNALRLCLFEAKQARSELAHRATNRHTKNHLDTGLGSKVKTKL